MNEEKILNELKSNPYFIENLFKTLNIMLGSTERQETTTDFIKDIHEIFEEIKNNNSHKVNVNGEVWEAICDDPNCDCHGFACDCNRKHCEYKETVKEIHKDKYHQDNCQDKENIPCRQEDYGTLVPYRWIEFNSFSYKVLEHIADYTVPQYGDYPNDQLSETSNECIIHDMKRYLNRFNTGQRGLKESMRDMLKIAHYAGVLYNRMSNVEALLNELPSKAQCATEGGCCQ